MNRRTNTQARVVCIPVSRQRRRNWLAYVRGAAAHGSAELRLSLRDVVRHSVAIALTAKTMPKTAEDVTIISEEVAREVIP